MVAAAAAAVCLTVTVAGPAAAHHDPSPPYVSKSQPDSRELFGFHHKALSATIDAWGGLQRHPDGRYRAWWKVQGDGRTMSVQFQNLTFWDGGIGGIDYNACPIGNPCTKGPSTGAIYYVGAWHYIASQAQATGEINARYAGGASTGWKCVDSYAVQRGARYPAGSPRAGC